MYDQKYLIVLEKMYNKVDMATLDNSDGEEPQDVNGYLGQTKYYRPKQGSVSRLIPEDEKGEGSLNYRDFSRWLGTSIH